MTFKCAFSLPTVCAKAKKTNVQHAKANEIKEYFNFIGTWA